MSQKSSLPQAAKSVSRVLMSDKEDVHELGCVSKKLRGLCDAIADGLRTPGLQQELLLLEGRQRAKPANSRSLFGS